MTATARAAPPKGVSVLFANRRPSADKRGGGVAAVAEQQAGEPADVARIVATVGSPIGVIWRLTRRSFRRSEGRAFRYAGG